MPTDDKEKKPVVIDNKIRNDWNDYVSFLREKGVAGSPELDKNNVGNNYLLQYIKEHPETSLSPDVIAPLQKDFMTYKDYVIDQVKRGKAVFQEGVTFDNFMQDLSKEDGIPGQFTTSHKFPREFMAYMDAKNNVEKVQDKGFAVVKQ